MLGGHRVGSVMKSDVFAMKQLEGCACMVFACCNVETSASFAGSCFCSDKEYYVKHAADRKFIEVCVCKKLSEKRKFL